MKQPSKQSPYRRLAVGIVLGGCLVAGGAVGLDGTADAAAATTRHPLAPRTSLERATVLAIAREHQRSADDAALQALAAAIYDESVRAAVDPLLVASIVAKESSFRPGAVSARGAIGLMQLRPFVAKSVAAQLSLEWPGIGALVTAQFNVRLGVHYYKGLVERFDGDAHKALTAYNVGPSRVTQQLRDGTYVGSTYARDVLALYSRLSSARSDV
ncbi:MAG TPA: lytic transglycosylase domain-containing protein [Candidatus Polarisedimenticolaceae bacterium]|nr:lytic transglycosylase domain-containing protein [Candidatus Polarisedimenticolaceae bacterium]